MNELELIMDRGLESEDNQKLKIKANVSTIEAKAKQIFGWRSATKKYSSIYERVQSLSSIKYDTLIKSLYYSGYGIN